MTRTSDQDHDAPEGAWYDIRVEGRLDLRWTSWLDMDLSHADDGTTLLHGRVVDQSALQGLLRRLHDLGLPLVSITQVEG